MAPFRSRDRTNRSGRGQVEHNALEGLPINQYREVEITVGANSADQKQVDKDAWPEPPMPRDSHMLPEHSQQILRAARSPRVVKPPAPPEEDKDLMDDEEDTKQVQQGFTVKKYVKVPRPLEEPEPEYLAKRRKGLPSQYAPANGQPSVQQAPMRETKIKKIDSEGNAVVYNALVPHGQIVEGEVQPSDAAVEIAPAAAAPGTVVEGVGVVNEAGVVVAGEAVQQTPPRRRPPPPKKKTKRSGPGRGKKKVVIVEGAEQGTPASVNGGETLAVPGVKQEGGASVEPSDGADTPMPDAGDEEEGSGEEGSDEDGHEAEHTPATGTPSQVPTDAVHGAAAEYGKEPTTVPVTSQELPVQKPKSEPVRAPEASPVTSTTNEGGLQTKNTPEALPEATQEAIPSTIGDELVVTQAEAMVQQPPPSTLASELPSAQSPQETTDKEPPPETSVAVKEDEHADKGASSSPDLPLSTVAHSRQNSLGQAQTVPPVETDAVPKDNVSPGAESLPASLPPQVQAAVSQETPVSDGEPDLMGSLEKELEKESET